MLLRLSINSRNVYVMDNFVYNWNLGLFIKKRPWSKKADGLIEIIDKNKIFQ